jgi:hypothetical protein
MVWPALKVSTSAAGGVEHVGAVAALAGPLELPVGDEVDQHVVLEQRDAGRGAHPLHQRALHGRAGGVGRVHDAALAVAAFARQVQFARVFAVF